MRAGFVTAVFLMSAGCSQSPVQDATENRDAQKAAAVAALVNEARAAVQDQLFDPESAQFDRYGHLVVLETGLVCGDVNARNRLGGYVGTVPYAYKRGHPVRVDAPNGYSSDVKEICPDSPAVKRLFEMRVEALDEAQRQLDAAR